jgi:excisionase family DNA binding protein
LIDPDKLYDIAEASPYTGKGRSATYRAIRNGQLRAVKTGRRTKLLVASPHEVIRSLC